MGMHTYISILRDKNNKEYQKKLKVLMACKEANIKPPDEINKYFGNDGLDCNPEYPLELDYDAKKWTSEYAEGLEIDIDDLPEDVKTIRFCNSY